MTLKTKITAKEYPLVTHILNLVQIHCSGEMVSNSHEIDVRWVPWLPFLEEYLGKFTLSQLEEMASSEDSLDGGPSDSVLNAFLNAYSGVD